MTQTAFSFLGWIGLLGGIWFLFDKSEAVASSETKASITHWLKGRDLSKVRSGPAMFVLTFDHVFGARHLSLRCFARSCIASILSVALLFLIWAALRPQAFIEFIGAGLTTRLIYVGIFTLIINVFPDYLSLLKTRYVIHWISKSSSVTRQILLATLDLVGTAIIAFVFLFGFAFLYLSIVLPPLFAVFGGNASIGKILEEALVTVGDAVRFGSRDPDFPSPGVWFWAAFFTAAWALVYVAAGVTVKVGRVIGLGAHRLLGLLNLEDKPITSLGWVSMVLVSVVYWGAAWGAAVVTLLTSS